MIDLKTIHYIKAIAEEGSFQKAAASLYISQPALSQYIKRIENELSFPLYERQNGKCVLTPPGEILLQKGSDILSQFDTMIEEMKICANSQKKDIYFGCPTGYSVPWFSEFLLHCKCISNCNYHLSEDSVESLINMLTKKISTLYLYRQFTIIPISFIEQSVTKLIILQFRIVMQSTKQL